MDKVVCDFCGKETDQSLGIIHRHADNSAVFICRTCVAVAARHLGMRGIAESKKSKQSNSNDDDGVKVISPETIYKELGRYVVGQDEYLRALSIFGHGHLSRISRMLKGDGGDEVPAKQNLFIIGPSGSGKTHGASALGRILDTPCHIGDLTAITLTGFVGGDVSDLLRPLLQSVGERFAHGILVLDETDKIRRRITRLGDRDINGEGVQEMLLKLIEGMELEIPCWKAGRTSRGDRDVLTVDTNRISIIACGAFSDLDMTGAKRMKERSIGFRTKEARIMPDKPGTDEIMHMLQGAGMLPEFLGRFNRFVLLDELGVDELKQILRSPKNSLLHREQDRFRSEGFELVVDESAVEYMAQKAHLRKLGARGLRMEMCEILDDIAFQHFGKGESGSVNVYANENGLDVEVRINQEMTKQVVKAATTA